MSNTPIKEESSASMEESQYKNPKLQSTKPTGFTYLNYNVILLKAMALYPFETDASLAFRAICWIWRVLNICALVGYCTQSLLYFATTKTNLLEMAPNIMQLLLYVSATVRTTYFFARKEKIKFIIEKINRIFKAETDTPIEVVSMEKYNSYAKILTVIWQINLNLTSLVIVCIPLALRPKLGNTLAFSLWYPWDWKENYLISFCHQFICQYFLGWAYSNPDHFYVASVLIVARQWDILGSNLKNVLYTALVNHGLPLEKVVAFSKCCNQYGRKKPANYDQIETNKNERLDNRRDDILSIKDEAEIEEIVRSIEFQKVLHKTMEDLIEEHKSLIECTEDLQEFLSPFVFMILGFGTAYMIFIVYCTTISHGSTLIGMILYFFTGSFENLLFSFFGHILLTKSENIQYSLYETPWYLFTEKFKSTFKFVFLRTKNPQIISGANFFIMRLNIFVSIERFIFSVYMLMRQMNMKGDKK